VQFHKTTPSTSTHVKLLRVLNLILSGEEGKTVDVFLFVWCSKHIWRNFQFDCCL